MELVCFSMALSESTRVAAIAALRNHPRLRQLGAESAQGMDHSTTRSKETFWKNWDREQTLAAALRPRLRPLFYVVSAIVALNMNVFYGLGYGFGWRIPRGLLLIDLSVLLAAANVVALVWHGRILAREAARVTTADLLSPTGSV